MAHLPLFPLSAPLFPGQSVPLQIFEPRYTKLVSDCMKSDSGFGVVQIREGREVGGVPQIFHFGCEARIVDFEALPNGLLGITIVGAHKFTVRSTAVAERNQLIADIDWLPDEPVLDIPAEYDGLQQLLVELKEHPAVSALKLPAVNDARVLGWQLCQLLPLSAPDRVALLSLSDPIMRLDHLAERVARMGSE